MPDGSGAASASIFRRAAPRGQAFTKDEILDLEHHLDVCAPIHSRSVPLRTMTERLELRLPRAQDVGFHARDRTDLARLEECSLRN